MSEEPPAEGALAERTPEQIAARRRLRNAIFFVVALALAFFVGFGAFNYVLMPRLVHGGGDVVVPDLANLTLEQAEKTLSATGLTLSRAGERFDPSVPRGFILSQDPPEGTPVRGRNRVAVVVSLGEEFSSVPELVGESRRAARLLLERAGLGVGGITRAPSTRVGEDLIAGSDPPAESVLPRGSTVALLVSAGAGRERYVMPSLIGREIGGARRQLEALGFRVLTPPGWGSIGAITWQEPEAGSRIASDTTIVLRGSGRVIR